MMKETSRSLRQYFALIAAITLIGVIGDLARGPLSSATVANVLTNLAQAMVLIYIAVRLPAMLPHPIFIQGVLGICGVWAVVCFVLSIGDGPSTQSIVVFVLSMLIVIYLMRSVARLSREAVQKNE